MGIATAMCAYITDGLIPVCCLSACGPSPMCGAGTDYPTWPAAHISSCLVMIVLRNGMISMFFASSEDSSETLWEGRVV